MDELAHKAGVHPQALLLNEAGCYNHILPSIRRVMELGPRPVEEDRQYRMFQTEKRRKSGQLLLFKEKTLTDLGPPTEKHPLIEFRNHLYSLRYINGISRMGLAKAICVQPAELYLLERGEKKTFSEQLRMGLQEAGLPATVVGELEYRTEEYAW